MKLCSACGITNAEADKRTLKLTGAGIQPVVAPVEITKEIVRYLSFLALRLS
jgi:hypothetical protein